MKKTACTVLLLTGIASPAFGQSTTALAEALNALPQFMLENPAIVQASFVDMTVLGQLLADPDAPPGEVLMRTGAGQGLYPLDAFQYGPEEWEQKSQIPIGDVRFFAGLGEGPNMIAVWGLENEDSAQGLVSDLAAHREFVPVAGGEILGNGEPNATDLAGRNVYDPWTGNAGQASFVLAQASHVLQATTPQGVTTLMGEGPGLADSAIVATALAGIDAAVGGGQIVQAMLVSPALGLQPADFNQLLGTEGDLDDMIAELQTGQSGIPPYFGGLMVDAQLDAPAAIFSLTFGDCDTANTALKQIETRWADTLGEHAPGPVSGQVVEGSDGLCAAAFTVVDETEKPFNAAFSAAFRAMMQRQLDVFQIGVDG